MFGFSGVVLSSSVRRISASNYHLSLDTALSSLVRPRAQVVISCTNQPISQELCKSCPLWLVCLLGCEKIKPLRVLVMILPCKRKILTTQYCVMAHPKFGSYETASTESNTKDNYSRPAAPRVEYWVRKLPVNVFYLRTSRTLSS